MHLNKKILEEHKILIVKITLTNQHLPANYGEL